MLNPVDLKEELGRERKHLHVNAEVLLDEIKAELEKDSEKEKDILNRVNNNDGNGYVNVDINKLDPDRIYTEESIRRICIKYRLRFLETGLYKGELPYDVILKTKKFESDHQCEIPAFKIMAPKNFFTLEDRYKDPLLFAPLGNGLYYLIAKWGNDLSWYRKLLCWPARNIITLLLSLALFSTLLVCSMPDSMFHAYGIEDYRIMNYRIGLALHLFIGFSMITVYLSFAFHLYPNSVEWDSKYYN